LEASAAASCLPAGTAGPLVVTHAEISPAAPDDTVATVAIGVGAARLHLAAFGRVADLIDRTPRVRTPNTAVVNVSAAARITVRACRTLVGILGPVARIGTAAVIVTGRTIDAARARRADVAVGAAEWNAPVIVGVRGCREAPLVGGAGVAVVAARGDAAPRVVAALPRGA